ncbi:hypothetical protein KKF55_05185 [Patescibacteria group bacterium]|nr:hypothetical protein [Patescibacteria group bacterium]
MNRKYAIRSLLATASTLLLAGTALAVDFATVAPFTQTEIDSNWEADRQFPTDGAKSVSAFSRDDVARIGLDNTQTAPGTFQRTEGIKTVGAQNFGTAVQVDLYLDPDWADNATRAGFWVAGDNGAGARDGYFGIIEFVNNETCPATGCSNQSNITDHEGWRVWDSNIGWSNVSTDFAYGEWVTLGIELDTDAQVYNYYINGDLAASGPAGENFIRELFLNSYNYGEDTFPTLGSDSYAAHWSAGPTDPVEKAECKKGGWEDFGFRNQGQCIRFVNTGKDSR